jgi:hypothetical protein
MATATGGPSESTLLGRMPLALDTYRLAVEDPARFMESGHVPMLDVYEDFYRRLGDRIYARLHLVLSGLYEAWEVWH